jgi:hypothetical protein
VGAATHVEDAAAERRVQPLVSPGGQKIDAERGTVERDSAEMLYGIDDKKKPAILR